MKKVISKFIFIFCLYMVLFGRIAFAQCTWSTVMTDGFEYTTICPDLIPGATIHNTPQSFAVHTGTTSLYLNFTNCVNGVGTCPGAKVYEKAFAVCPNMPMRFSSWLTTSFGGTQCNVKITITDANGTVLNNQLSIAPVYFPLWTQYQSPAVVPITDTIIFTMYTNVGGGGGNDLSMDDFMLEKCVGGENSTTSESVCGNTTGESLYLSLGLNDTTGNWSGGLSGGYLGTFVPAVNAPGVYVYQNNPYGTGVGCPAAYDSVVVSLSAAPVVNLGNDTTLCTNQNIVLNAGSGAGYTYLWSNGVTGPTVVAFTSGGVPMVKTYSVTVTDANGCVETDSISINFQICSGINDNFSEAAFTIFPNPSAGDFNVQLINPAAGKINYFIYNATGAMIKHEIISGNLFSVQLQEPGMYLLQIMTENGNTVTKKLIVNN